MERSRSLAQLLGRADGARLLIINADDFGMCHAENVATAEGLDSGAFCSSTIMMPCPWVEEAIEYASHRPQADLGVHITHTSEWERYKWGPVCGADSVPSLVTARGYFHHDVGPFYAHARLDEVERETRAQIDAALAAGIDVTHLDSHMGTVQLRPEHHELYLRLAAEYRLPVRMAGRRMLQAMNMEQIIATADGLGVLYPDHFWFGGPPEPGVTAAYWTEMLRNLMPGVTEIYIHPAVDDAELRGMTASAAQREADYRFFASASTRALLDELGIERVGYRAIRELQRRSAPC
jgi:predicted glycoside hydrolase/deacetylase ChbG (UPF0249 family)